jgi:hypothetical protein
MQLIAVALVGLGAALVTLAGYHRLVVGPQLRRLGERFEAHDELLGGGSAPASQRLGEVEAAAAGLREEAATMQNQIAALERIARTQTPRIGFIRYNAFDDVGSDQSYTLALLTEEGDGVVLSSIYSREETRTYGKAVEKFQTAQDASREEQAAIARARASAS